MYTIIIKNNNSYPGNSLPGFFYITISSITSGDLSASVVILPIACRCGAKKDTGDGLCRK
jgi:hypothetical protein